MNEMVGDTHCLHVEDGRLHKAWAEVFNNVGRDAQGDAVLAQGAHNQHLLERVTVVPLAWKKANREDGTRSCSSKLLMRLAILELGFLLYTL